MSSSSSSSTGPFRTPEEAYTEWLIKAVEVVAESRRQSGRMRTLPKSDWSRHFEINTSESFGARRRISEIQKIFTHEKYSLHVEVRRGEDQVLVEKWTFGFDSGKDIIPTARSDRRDQTLSRRLVISIRTLISFTRLFARPGKRNLEVSLHLIEGTNEQSPVSDTWSVSSGGTSPKQSISCEVCSVASSFGMITLTYWGTAVAHDTHTGFSSVDEESVDSPRASPLSFAPKIKECFIQAVNQTQSLRAEETLVLEIKTDEECLSPNQSRHMGSEICPVSNLSYDFSEDSSQAEDWISPVPALGRHATAIRTGGAFDVSKYRDVQFVERPLTLAALTEELDRLLRTYSKR